MCYYLNVHFQGQRVKWVTDTIRQCPKLSRGNVRLTVGDAGPT